MCYIDHDWVIEIPGRSFLSAAMDANAMMPLRFYYTNNERPES
jgi:hypothetical protein